MDLIQLANLGEFIGGVAVLVTLVYLTVQIRQNARQTREKNGFALMNDLLRAFSDLRRDIARDSVLASIWRRGRENLEDLDKTERTQFDCIAVEVLWAFGRLFVYDRQHTIDPGLLEQGLSALPRYVGGNGMEHWWRSSGYRAEFPEALVVAVDRMLLRGDAT